MIRLLGLGLPACLLAAAVLGCGEPAGDDADDRLAQLEKLVPASGVVRIGGKPAPRGVVVAFFEGSWAPAHGETDDQGRYSLTTAARPGAVPASYKVTLSRLIAADGRVLGLADRSGFTPDPAVATATEQLPPAAAAMDRSTLTATVPPGGSDAINLDVDGDLAEPPKAEAKPAEAKPEAEAEAKPAEAPAPK